MGMLLAVEEHRTRAGVDRGSEARVLDRAADDLGRVLGGEVRGVGVGRWRRERARKRLCAPTLHSHEHIAQISTYLFDIL